MAKKSKPQELAETARDELADGLPEGVAVEVSVTSDGEQATAKTEKPDEIPPLTQWEIEVEREIQKQKIAVQICEQSDAWQAAHCEWSSAAAEAKELKKDAESEQNKLNRLNRKLSEVMAKGWAPAVPEPEKADPQKKLFTPPDDPAERMLLSVLCEYDTPEGKLTATKCDKLADAVGGDTIKHLEDFMRSNPHWNTSMKGIGEKYLTILQDAHLAFRLAHPIPAEEPKESPEGRASGIAYDAGRKSAEAGDSEASNPYNACTDNGQAWLDGWDSIHGGLPDAGTADEPAEAIAS